MAAAALSKALANCVEEVKEFALGIENDKNREVYFDFIIPLSYAPELRDERKVDTALLLTQHIWRALAAIDRFEVRAIVTHAGWTQADRAPGTEMILLRIHLLDKTVAIPVPPFASAPVA